MKKTLSLFLLLVLLSSLLVACQEPEPALPEGTPSLIVLPESVNMIAIHCYSEETTGPAYFDKNNYGAFLQLLDELRVTYLIADPTLTNESFLFDDCYDVNVYGTDGTLMQISVDKNNAIYINGAFFRQSSGALSYGHIGEYHRAFQE